MATRRPVIRGIAAALLALVLGACAPAATPPSTDVPGADGFPRTVTDGAGRSVRLPARPLRIVSQTLASDEMLFPMVAPERLVGLSSLSRDPKYSNVVTEATRHPAPSIESAEDIVRLRPDLVFVTTYSRAELVQVLESTGAPVYRLANFDDLEGVVANLRRIGAAVGDEPAAERMVTEMQRRLAAVAARRAGRPPMRVLSFSGGFTAGRGTTFDDIVRRANGVNEAAARGLEKFPKLSEEQVLAWNPDVLVAGVLPGETESARRRLLTGAGVGQTTAARRNQIVLIDTRRLLAVSQHVVDAVEQLADGLDAFQAAR
ncbi:MAG: ABC transporter substrate-binding protein [Vicinamibacteraceae bacterium]